MGGNSGWAANASQIGLSQEDPQFKEHCYLQPIGMANVGFNSGIKDYTQLKTSQ